MKIHFEVEPDEMTSRIVATIFQFITDRIEKKDAKREANLQFGKMVPQFAEYAKDYFGGRTEKMKKGKGFVMPSFKEKPDHKLDVRSKFYSRMVQGDKCFEVRKIKGRVFSEGQIVRFWEIEDQPLGPVTEIRTGKWFEAEISYVLSHETYPGVAEGYVVFGFKR